MAVNRTPTWPAGVFYEANWLTGPLVAFPPPLWTDTSSRFIGALSTIHGTDFELDRNQAGEFRPIVDNRDGALDPTNTLSPIAGVAPYKGLRWRFAFGPNELTADQATAGEASGFLGSIPLFMNVVNDFGYPVSIVASGSAYQGTQVYQAVLPNGATQFATILMVKPQPCVPGRVYSFQAQARITAGNSVSTNISILWYNQAGTLISSITGTAQTLTSGSGSWTQVAASGQAPAGAFSAALKVEIASGILSAQTTWQLDGLQFENSGYPTTWQQPGLLGGNLLPRVIATGSASMDPVHDAVTNWWYSTGSGTLAQANYLATAAPPGQTTALAWTTPSGTTSSNAVLYAGVAPSVAPSGPVEDCVQVTAGQQYTASAYLSRTSSADATVAVTLSIQWYNSAGTALTPSAGAAATVAVGSWVRATVTATAPAGAVWGRISAAITTPATTTASNTIYATGWQFEQAGAASTWVDPGPTLFGFWGFWEQLPQQWRLSGTWGELDATGVDALAGLAQFNVIAPFIHEVLILSPNFFYPLGDPQGSAQVVDQAGKRVPAPIENSPFGPGSFTLGNSVTSTTPGVAFLGTPGPVGTFANSPSQTSQQAQTFISLHKTTAMPGPPTSGPWTRMVAFRCSTIPASGTFPTLWNANAPSFGGNQSLFQIYLNPTTGDLTVQLTAANGSGPVANSSAGVCDGNWHLVMAAFEGNGYFTVYLDGAQIYRNNNGGSGWSTATGIVTDVLGCSITPGASNYSLGFVGDAAFAAEFPSLLTAAQVTNLYNSFRSASSGESSGARFARLLSWMNYAGPTAIDSGSTQTMGPANDLNGGTGLDGAFAIATTETGDAYASNAGVLTFKARSALYNSQPMFVFGENQAAGEWPYEDVVLPVDPLHTYNIVPVTQWDPGTGTIVNGYTVSGQVATAQDTASQQANFPRTAPSTTINSTSFAEVQAAAAYLLQRYKTNRMRCKNLRLHPAAIPGLWRVCAQLEKGVRIRVMRRPPWRPTTNPIQFDGFVTKCEWSVDPKTMDAYLTVEAAPADPNTYWTTAALHTTLNAQAASGQNKATINALPDAAVNKLSQSLPSGYQLTFDPGTAIAETMTIAAGGIPSTSLGYTTAQLTFTTNFQHTHAANAIVCEPLPTGYTDPTTWDANSQLGAASTTVLSGGGSGTNTVTVGPLADAATNSLGSNWNEGDTIWLSPGSGNFESATVLSVAATVPGYTSCQLTLTANLAHSHSPGDTVCDPLPNGVTTPPAGTMRLAY